MPKFVKYSANGSTRWFNPENVTEIAEWVDNGTARTIVRCNGDGDDSGTMLRGHVGSELVKLFEGAGAGLSSDPATAAVDAVFPEVQRAAVLSTAHMTLNDDTLLCAWEEPEVAEGIECKCWLDATEFGHRIRVTGDDFPDEFEEMDRLGLSKELIAILVAARDNGFDEVVFDRDAAESKSFPVFEW